MPRTLAVVTLALLSLVAAAVAALVRPVARPPQRAGSLRMSTQLDRRSLPESGGEAVLQIDLAAAASDSVRARVPVNAVLVLDRSGSMTGPKMDRAREAARALVQTLGPGDRFALIEFSSDASVLIPSAPMTAAFRARALEAIELLQPMGGTNMSAAFDAAAPELARGRAPGRVDKVFLASDGQANEGVSDREGLLRLAQIDFARATLSTFGMGEDYDEDLMTAFAAQNGGRARYISSPEVLPAAFRDELSRAATAVARNVRVRIAPFSGASVERVLGYDEADAGWVRLPDFAAGEERRVLVKLRVPGGRGAVTLAQVDLQFDEAASEAHAFAHDSVQAMFTSDVAQLAVAPSPAAFDYAQAASAIDAAGVTASKALKEKAFDAVRAPVKGW